MKFNEKYFDELLEKNRSQNLKMNISDLIVVVWLDHVGKLNNSEYVGFQDLKNFESVMSQKISEVEDESERKKGFGSLVDILSSLTHSKKQLERVNRIRQIFLDQEKSYEIYRFDSEHMEEFVTERVPEIWNGEKSYYDFVVSLYQIFDSRIHDLLSDMDNDLENYSSVRNEYEEHDWDLVFESKFLSILDLIDQNR